MYNKKQPLLDTGDKHWLGFLLSPSWVSLLFGICCAFGIVIGVIFAANYQGTSYQQQVLEIRAQQTTGEYSSDDAEFYGLEGNSFIDIAPLLVMWGVVGIVIYFFALSIVQSLQHAAEFKSQLDYVNSSRNHMLKTAFIHLGIRLLVAGIFIVYILVFFNHIVPYAVNSTLAASAVGLISFEAFLYLSLAILAIIVAMHIYTILLRLLFLRPRVFTKALYIY